MSERADLIARLARTLGWKFSGPFESGDSPREVLGARWDEASEVEKTYFLSVLKRLEEDPERRRLLLGLDPDAPLPAPAPPPAPATRNRYRVKREHAIGGMGRILVVIDEKVGREVALKELLPGLEAAPLDRERFLREARITGQLEHPSIVPVYEIGEGSDGAPYYTMKLVRGATLGERLVDVQRKGGLSPREKLEERLKLLDAFLAVCDAVGYAHSRGVVNRDLKPDNVMIGDFGETVVLDWGLARKLEEDEPAPAKGAAATPGENRRKGDTTRLTLDGDIMGTPEYMSPEQARGEIESVDELSDVFALGAILFEILTGRPPFVGVSALEVLHDVMHREAPRADAVDPTAPRELGAVAAAAMQRDRGRRLPSARALADEIRAWRDGRRMTVYRHTSLEQVRRFARRNRALSASLAAAAAILVAGTIVSLMYARIASLRAESERRAVEIADARADEARRANAAKDAALALAQGQRHAAYAATLLSENPTAALVVAMEAARKAPGAASTNALWSALASLQERRRFEEHEFDVNSGRFSPDGALVATAGSDFTARVWEAGTGRQRFRLEGHRSAVTVVEWSDDGGLLLTAAGHPDDERVKLFVPAGSVDAAPRIWDAATGACARVLGGHTGGVRGARWAAGGRVLTWSDDGTARLWDRDGGATVFRAGGDVREALVSRDGRWIVARASGGIFLWSAGEPTRPRCVAGPGDGVEAIDFSADSKWLVSGDDSGRVLGRDVETLAPAREARPVHRSREATAVYGIRIHPDGTRVAVHTDLGLHVWDAALARQASSIDFEDGWLSLEMLDPDWARVLIRKYPIALARDVVTGADVAVFRGHEYNLEFACFSPDGRRVLTGGRDRVAIVWDAEPGACLPAFRACAEGARSWISPDGGTAVAAVSDSRLEVRDNATGALLKPLDTAARAEHVQFVGDGTRFIVGLEGGARRLADAARGWLFEIEPAGGVVRWWRASANGDWILVNCHGEQARIWNAKDGKAGPVFECPRVTNDWAAVSDDGRVFAAVEADRRRVNLFDSGGAPLGSLTGHNGWTISSAFAPDGTILTTAMDASVRAWDASSLKELRSGRWPVIRETYVAVSPDGRTVALHDGETARFYSFDTLDEIGALPRGFSPPVGFSRDGRFVAARRGAAVVRLPLDALEFASRVAPRELTPLEHRGTADSRAEADLYRAAWAERPPPPGTFIRSAERAIGRGDGSEALLQARRAAALLPAHPWPHELEAEAHGLRAASLPESDPARARAVEEGVAALEAAIERGFRDVETMENADALSSLRGHPRWPELVRRARQLPWEDVLR